MKITKHLTINSKNLTLENIAKQFNQALSCSNNYFITRYLKMKKKKSIDQSNQIDWLIGRDTKIQLMQNWIWYLHLFIPSHYINTSNWIIAFILYSFLFLFSDSSSICNRELNLCDFPIVNNIYSLFAFNNHHPLMTNDNDSHHAH